MDYKSESREMIIRTVELWGIIRKCQGQVTSEEDQYLDMRQVATRDWKEIIENSRVGILVLKYFQGS